MKNALTFLAISMLLIFFDMVDVNAEEQSIQSLIDTAASGDTIQLDEGIYEESVVINQPIHLIGEGDVTLIQQDASPVFTIQSNNVDIENIMIIHEDDHHESPAILINGHHNKLHNINIETNSYGIQLDQANDNTLSYVHIIGDQDAFMKDRQHGIDIWESHRNEIYDSTIQNVQDGIYVEKSHDTVMYDNTVFQSRYGYHLMFTKNSKLENNESYHNISGMMVMGADGTVVKDNQLTNNQTNIQSLGLLLFDTKNATITNNQIANNRIGIFIEDAHANHFTLNDVNENYIGLQFKSAENNEINRNAFVANVVQGQAQESTNNDTNHNYWGDHVGLDMTGEQTSSLPYKVDPFFLDITSEYPAFQLLFQAPGMIFLEQLIHTPVEEQLIDSSPLLEDPLLVSNEVPQYSLLLFSACLGLFIFSIFIIYLGVRRHEKV